MGGFFKSVARVAAPVIGNMIAPGIGGVIGGAVGTAATGGDLKDTLISGALGGVSAAAPNITGSLAGSAGKAVQSGITGALKGGALGGIATGDAKGALSGALLGGAGGYVGAGGNVPGLGSVGKSGSLTAEGVPIPGRKPTGILGGASKAASQVSQAGGAPSGLLGGSGNMLGNTLRAGAAGYSQQQTEEANEEIRRRLLQAQGKAEGALQPFYDTGQQANEQLSQLMQDPSSVQESPAYNFRVEEGERALRNQLAASGMSQSGAAMRRALELGQQMGSQEYDNQFNRLQGVGQQGAMAAGDMANLYRDTGGVEAEVLAANQQSRDRMLSQILGGFVPPVQNYGFLV